MSSLDFPSSPTNGQTYIVNGISYRYDSAVGAWIIDSYVSSDYVLFSLNHANAAFDQANTASDRSNVALGYSNVASDTANSALELSVFTYEQANIARTHANAAFAAANNVEPKIAPTYVQANTARSHANAAFEQANNAYVQANAAAEIANTKLALSGGTVTGDLAIVGTLTISGNTFITEASSLKVSDPLLYLAGNNYTSDIVDIGFIANYVNATGQNVHTGLYREHEDKEYYLFQGYDQEPINNHIGAMSNNMTLAVLNADIKTSNLILGGINAISRIESAFNKANNALANTSGVSFDGSLNFPTGNVGIGTTLPSSKLEVSGDAVNSLSNLGTGDNATITITNTNVGGFNRIAKTLYEIGNLPVASVAAAYTLFNGGSNIGGALILSTQQHVGAGVLERMRVDAYGNVLIGRTNSTTGYGVRLDVNGLANTTGFTAVGYGQTLGTGFITSGYGANIGGSIVLADIDASPGAGGALIFGAAGHLWKYAAIKGVVLNGTSNSVGDITVLTRRNTSDSTLTETARFTYTGNVLIGRTDSTVGQNVKLDVNGAINASAVLVNGQSVSKPRVFVASTNTSPLVWNSNNYDQYSFTGLTNALTLNADAGSPVDGQKIIFRFKPNGAQTLTWTTGTANSFRAMAITFPTSLVSGKTTYVGCIYNAFDSRWDVVATSTEP